MIKVFTGTSSLTKYINEGNWRSGCVEDVHNTTNTASNTVYDPIILDLDGDGFNVETKENGTNFDLDKNGFAEKINWTAKDGFLCLDLNGTML